MEVRVCENCGKELQDKGYVSSCPSCGKRIEKNTYKEVLNPTEEHNKNVKSFNIVSAYIEMFKRWKDFDGRSTRSEYWYAYLANVILSFVVSFLVMTISFAVDAEGLLVLFYFFAGIYSLITFVPCLALSVRRLHDTGRSGGMLFLTFIPFGIGSIILLIKMVEDSQYGDNAYGPYTKKYRVG